MVTYVTIDRRLSRPPGARVGPARLRVVDDGPALAAAVHEALLARGQTIACAESLTGGELAALLSATPGASRTFRGAVVGYATEVKRAVLGVTAPAVVSEECAVQMADGVRRLLAADWAVSTTGVAGPTEQEGQPVGTVFVGLAGLPETGAVRHRWAGSRTEVRHQACLGALREVLDALR